MRQCGCVCAAPAPVSCVGARTAGAAVGWPMLMSWHLPARHLPADEDCAACDFNRPGKTCLREMEWVWRGETFSGGWVRQVGWVGARVPAGAGAAPAVTVPAAALFGQNQAYPLPACGAALLDPSHLPAPACLTPGPLAATRAEYTSIKTQLQSETFPPAAAGDPQRLWRDLAHVRGGAPWAAACLFGWLLLGPVFPSVEHAGLHWQLTCPRAHPPFFPCLQEEKAKLLKDRLKKYCQKVGTAVLLQRRHQHCIACPQLPAQLPTVPLALYPSYVLPAHLPPLTLYCHCTAPLYCLSRRCTSACWTSRWLRSAWRASASGRTLSTSTQ